MSTTINARELQPGYVFKKHNHHRPIGVMSVELVKDRICVTTVDCRSKKYNPDEALILVERNDVAFLASDKLQHGMIFSHLRDRRRLQLDSVESVGEDPTRIALLFYTLDGETMPALPCGRAPYTDHSQRWRMKTYSSSLVIVTKVVWKPEWDNLLVVVRCINCGRPDPNAKSLLDECPYCFFKHDVII